LRDAGKGNQLQQVARKRHTPAARHAPRFELERAISSEFVTQKQFGEWVMKA
jgi:hypothetical protein